MCPVYWILFQRGDEGKAFDDGLRCTHSGFSTFSVRICTFTHSICMSLHALCVKCAEVCAVRVCIFIDNDSQLKQ